MTKTWCELEIGDVFEFVEPHDDQEGRWQKTTDESAISENDFDDVYDFDDLDEVEFIQHEESWLA